MNLFDDLRYLFAVHPHLLPAIAMVMLLLLHTRLAWARMERDRRRDAATTLGLPEGEQPLAHG